MSVASQSRKESLGMLRKVVWTSLCFGLISGCALMETSDVEVEKQSVAMPAPDLQVEAPVSQPVIAAPLTERQSPSSKNKNISAEQIKRIQFHLKKAGFYSGSVDGIAGPRTQSAIRHFQSGCSTLTDLITPSEPTVMQQDSGMTAKAVSKSKQGAADEVRLIQLRLKDAGFKLGPIDGIDGPKTRAARLALQSGCMMLDNIPTVPLNDAQAPTGDSTANGRKVSALIQRATNRESEDSTGTTADNSIRGAIKVLQMRLREAGFDVGPIDGILGSRTITAAQNYLSSLR
jgi:peptidoglycan hydrolase-like protein with peptidoglycan-binding domain